MFFINELENSINLPNENRTLPLPPSQVSLARRKPSLSQRIVTAVKKPPKLLVRLSSTYFRPAPIENNQRKRTKSAKFENIDLNFHNLDAASHKRAFSNVPKRDSSLSESPKLARQMSNTNFANKSCSMCCDNPCNAVLMECGHGGICYECSLKLWKSKGSCHMCREQISQVLQIDVEANSLLKVLSTTRAVYGDNNQNDEY